jgi:hypothetical protein
MPQNNRRLDEYEDQVLHHHAFRRGDVVAGWSLAIMLALVAAFALGIDNVTAVGDGAGSGAAAWGTPATPPLSEQIGLNPGPTP